MENAALEFINTIWNLNNKPYEEKLRTNSWTIYYAKKNNFSHTLFKDIDKLINLRQLYHTILVESIKRGEIPKEFIQSLNEYLSKITFKKRVVLEDNKLNTIYLPKIKELDLLPHIITISFIDLLNEVDQKRIKVCENETCSFIFYDESKNKSRKWCSNKCASLIKVRNHREKNKSSEAAISN